MLVSLFFRKHLGYYVSVYISKACPPVRIRIKSYSQAFTIRPPRWSRVEPINLQQTLKEPYFDL